MKRILVGLGGTTYTRAAINRGIDLAERFGAELTGVTVVDVGQLMNVGAVPLGGASYAAGVVDHHLDVTADAVDDVLASFEDRCAAHGIRYRVERESGDPFSLMISHGRYHDLTLFGLRSLFDYGLVSQPKELLTRLLTAGVRPIIAASEDEHLVERVLIAYSGSMESAKAMRRYTQIQPFGDVDVHLVHYEEQRGAGDALLRDAGDYLSAHGISCIAHKRRAPAREDLLPLAEEIGADLLVMGNSARKSMLTRLVGDTTLHAIQNATIPLFLAQ